MTKTYALDVEVPGGFGARTRLDSSVHPPVIHALHVVFDGWLGDQLVECFPCYLVTEQLAETLVAAGITGFRLAEVEVETSLEFRELHSERTLPPFRWLQVTGTTNGTDVFMAPGHRLGCSQRTLDLILVTEPVALEFDECP